MSPSLNGSHQLSPHEIKFLLPRALAGAVRDWARTFMKPDPHAAAEMDHAYLVRSLYLDTAEHDVFHRRGSYARGKYRIRQYLPNGILFLERKMKTKGVVRKRRTQTQTQELSWLARKPHADWHGYWYQRRLELRKLLPVCQISYLRYAFVGSEGGATIRLTMDEQIFAVQTRDYQFENAANDVALLPDKTIMELKFAGDTPGLFKRLLDEFGLSPEPVSKYRLALPALGLAAIIEAKEESVTAD